MVFLVYLLAFVVVYGGAAAGAYEVSGGDSQKFLYWLAPAFAAATVIVAPFSTMFSARYQQRTTADLEKLRNEMVQYNDLLRADRGELSELRKTVSSGRMKAFDLILTAAYTSHYLLQSLLLLPPLEKPEDEKRLLAEVEQRLAEAFGQSWHLEPGEREIWREVYQITLYLSDICIVVRDPKVREREWNSRAEEFGICLDRLEVAGRGAFAVAQQLNSAPPEKSAA